MALLIASDSFAGVDELRRRYAGSLYQDHAERDLGVPFEHIDDAHRAQIEAHLLQTLADPGMAQEDLSGYTLAVQHLGEVASDASLPTLHRIIGDPTIKGGLEHNPRGDAILALGRHRQATGTALTDDEARLLNDAALTPPPRATRGSAYEAAKVFAAQRDPRGIPTIGAIIESEVVEPSRDHGIGAPPRRSGFRDDRIDAARMAAFRIYEGDRATDADRARLLNTLRDPYVEIHDRRPDLPGGSEIDEIIDGLIERQAERGPIADAELRQAFQDIEAATRKHMQDLQAAGSTSTRSAALADRLSRLAALTSSATPPAREMDREDAKGIIGRLERLTREAPDHFQRSHKRMMPVQPGRPKGSEEAPGPTPEASSAAPTAAVARIPEGGSLWRSVKGLLRQDPQRFGFDGRGDVEDWLVRETANVLKHHPEVTELDLVHPGDTVTLRPGPTGTELSFEATSGYKPWQLKRKR
ncbi:MAG: hypothetical protein HY718_02860 [Planctomycetes bacterium]|nr:hypothetical protein [Planctomycetota bacterium]